MFSANRFSIIFSFPLPPSPPSCSTGVPIKMGKTACSRPAARSSVIRSHSSSTLSAGLPSFKVSILRRAAADSRGIATVLDARALPNDCCSCCPSSSLTLSRNTSTLFLSTVL